MLPCLTAGEPARLVTASYWSVPPGFQPVRTSRGVPDHLADVPALWAAAPTRTLVADFGKSGWADAYVRLLEQRADSLMARLDVLSARYDALAFCCYERSPRDCHRAVLGQWLHAHGHPVEAIR